MALRTLTGIPVLVCVVSTLAQVPASDPQPAPVEFTCPMDPEVRSKTPGTCPRCGMKLVANIPANGRLRIEVRVRDPKSGAPVKQFQIIHEKPIHLFVVSEDLEYFAHEHPELGADGVFRHVTVLPKPGTYKLLADFMPEGGTPQLISRVVTTAGYTRSLGASIVKPAADLAPKHGQNLDVELVLDPPQPMPGKKTMLFFKLKPAAGLEPYIGAWGHMLAASNDLIDTIHTHPIYVTDPAPGEKQVQFNLFFPREAIYRVWVQFQREGKVNTVDFTIPVVSLH